MNYDELDQPITGPGQFIQLNAQPLIDALKNVRGDEDIDRILLDMDNITTW